MLDLGDDFFEIIKIKNKLISLHDICHTQFKTYIFT